MSVVSAGLLFRFPVPDAVFKGTEPRGRYVGESPRHPLHGGSDVTADHFEQVLEGLRQHQPFRVFAVDLHGGRRFEIDHPGALVVRDGVAVFIAPGGIPIWFGHESVNQIVGAPANTPL
jgi:hypothetical protein